MTNFGKIVREFNSKSSEFLMQTLYYGGMTNLLIGVDGSLSIYSKYDLDSIKVVDNSDKAKQKLLKTIIKNNGEYYCKVYTYQCKETGTYGTITFDRKLPFKRQISQEKALIKAMGGVANLISHETFNIDLTIITENYDIAKAIYNTRHYAFMYIGTGNDMRVAPSLEMTFTEDQAPRILYYKVENEYQTQDSLRLSSSHTTKTISHETFLKGLEAGTITPMDIV